MKKYVREFIARFRKFSIEKKLKWLRMVVIIPALVGIITLLVIMINFNESYNEAVKNVSVASLISHFQKIWIIKCIVLLSVQRVLMR